jgi:hypothetical protein
VADRIAEQSLQSDHKYFLLINKLLPIQMVAQWKFETSKLLQPGFSVLHYFL